ncbi:GNAT family N-acetyltransferase [Aggregatilineales bacterium SYSU G02658]
MADMLVKLYELPPLEPALTEQRAKGVLIRRGIAPEKHHVAAWVARHFSAFWASEVEVAFSRAPLTCFLALADDRLIGFACHDVTFKGFFGPTGVSEAARGRGTGHALLLASLHDLRALGYAYGVIGAVGPADFYKKAVNALDIPDSTPGPYAHLLRSSE